jgi:hypothetical protein
MSVRTRDELLFDEAPVLVTIAFISRYRSGCRVIETDGPLTGVFDKVSFECLRVDVVPDMAEAWGGNVAPQGEPAPNIEQVIFHGYDEGSRNEQIVRRAEVWVVYVEVIPADDKSPIDSALC